VTSFRIEVTQKVEFEVELDMAIGMVALSIAVGMGMVALSIGMVEFMVELATNGSVLVISHDPTGQAEKYSRLETNELSNKRVHTDDIGDIGTVDVVTSKVGAASGREV
jgi:hypothetical protein